MGCQGLGISTVVPFHTPHPYSSVLLASPYFSLSKYLLSHRDQRIRRQHARPIHCCESFGRRKALVAFRGVVLLQLKEREKVIFAILDLLVFSFFFHSGYKRPDSGVNVWR